MSLSLRINVKFKIDQKFVKTFKKIYYQIRKSVAEPKSRAYLGFKFLKIFLMQQT